MVVNIAFLMVQKKVPELGDSAGGPADKVSVQARSEVCINMWDGNVPPQGLMILS